MWTRGEVLIRRIHRLLLAIGFLVALSPGAAHAAQVGDGGGTSTVQDPLVTTAPDGSIQVPPFNVRAGHGGPKVHTAPEDSAPVLSGLFLDTSLQVTAERVDGNGNLWYAIRLWDVFPGWVRADQTEVGPSPLLAPGATTPTSDATATPTSAASSSVPLKTTGHLTDQYILRDSPGTDGDVVDVIAASASVAVDGWATDSDGSAWFHVAVAGESGWIWASGIQLAASDPNKVTVNGRPIWAPVSGKGMWVPIPLLKMASPEALISAASELGLTHLYVEVGSSDGGFYGGSQLNRLLPIAHAHGISVIGWVMTTLNDLPGDVNLCTQLAAYRTPSGDRLDGIAPDIEKNMYPPDVKTFAQVLRYEVGPSELIVGVIYPAGTWIGEQHPIVGPLSHSFNVLAPMDYWHDAPGSVSDGLIQSFVQQSVADIHAVAGPNYPVAVIGQAYDGFARDGTGPDNPAGHEVSAALTAADSSGAVGVSLFQWGTATPSEWAALREFRWRG